MILLETKEKLLDYVSAGVFSAMNAAVAIDGKIFTPSIRSDMEAIALAITWILGSLFFVYRMMEKRASRRKLDSEASINEEIARQKKIENDEAEKQQSIMLEHLESNLIEVNENLSERDEQLLDAIEIIKKQKKILEGKKVDSDNT